MTPEQTQELAALKAALKQHIEEAEKFKDVRFWMKSISPEADVFIAQARTMSPLACRIALAGIEALEETAANDDRNSHWWSTAENDLLFILNLWKQGNP